MKVRIRSQGLNTFVTYKIFLLILIAVSSCCKSNNSFLIKFHIYSRCKEILDINSIIRLKSVVVYVF